jgi:hypothetical protein
VTRPRHARPAAAASRRLAAALLCVGLLLGVSSCADDNSSTPNQGDKSDQRIPTKAGDNDAGGSVPPGTTPSGS